MRSLPSSSDRVIRGGGATTQLMPDDEQGRAGSTDPSSMKRSSPSEMGAFRSVLLAVSKLAILIFAFGITWCTGHRGIFFLDQSMVYDGAWRILQGQVPYRDFYMPFGPVTFWIQAIFFKLFGMSFSSMVLSAAVVNVVATASIMRMGRLLGLGSPYPALAGGIITAIWFQGPFGTLWMEQVAFLFVCLALQLVLEADHLSSNWSRLIWFLSGCCVACAILSKQNAGGFFLPICIGVVFVQNLRLPRRLISGLIWFSTGALLSTLAFFIWLKTCSDPSLFWRHTVEIASEIGQRRLLIRPLALISGVFLCKLTPVAATPVNLLSLVIGPAFLILGLLNFDLKPGQIRQSAVLGFLAITLPLYQNLFAISTANEPENAQPFVGFILCLSIAGISWLCQKMNWSVGFGSGSALTTLRLPSRRLMLLSGMIILSSMAAFLAAQGVQVDRTRMVQQFNRDTRFGSRINAAGLAGVSWGEPTPTQLGEVIIHREDFENLAHYLQTRKGSFFVAGDATMLYGMLRRQSPQPLLYFCLNHSYTARDIPRLDPVVLRSLQARDVQTVVKEQFTFLKGQDEYATFPRTWSWLTHEFKPARQFGIYEVWERKQIAGTGAMQ